MKGKTIGLIILVTRKFLKKMRYALPIKEKTERSKHSTLRTSVHQYTIKKKKERKFIESEISVIHTSDK